MTKMERRKQGKKRWRKCLQKKDRIFIKKVSEALKIRVAYVPGLVGKKCQDDTTRSNIRCLNEQSLIKVSVWNFMSTSEDYR